MTTFAFPVSDTVENIVAAGTLVAFDRTLGIAITFNLGLAQLEAWFVHPRTGVLDLAASRPVIALDVRTIAAAGGAFLRALVEEDDPEVP